MVLLNGKIYEIAKFQQAKSNDVMGCSNATYMTQNYFYTGDEWRDFENESGIGDINIWMW
jgi:hypothetical protein